MGVWSIIEITEITEKGGDVFLNFSALSIKDKNVSHKAPKCHSRDAASSVKWSTRRGRNPNDRDVFNVFDVFRQRWKYQGKTIPMTFARGGVIKGYSYYFQRGSSSQFLGKPMAVISTLGYLSNNTLNFFTKSLSSYILSSQYTTQHNCTYNL